MIHLPSLRRFPVPHAWAPSAGQLLAGGTVVAIVLANSPLSGPYAGFWQQEFGVFLGPTTFHLPLSGWISDALLTLFFLVVGLEIKREFTRGSLQHPKAAALPIAAAIGGMAVPAALYLLIIPAVWVNGWGIPLSADTAFVVALIVALGSRVPVELRIFLTAAMVVDDVIAVSVVALFYSGTLHLGALALAGVVAGLIAILSCFCNVRAITPYAVLGVLLWLLIHESGVHATLAGIVLAAFVPAGGEDSPGDKLLERVGARSAYVVLPLFALANAGVTVSPELLAGRELLGMAIIVGLVVGKPLGIVGACYLATRCKLATKPDMVTWHHLIGAGCLSGIGFTMSLFIAGQTLSGVDLEAAKLAILAASLVSACLGFAILARHPKG